MFGPVVKIGKVRWKSGNDTSGLGYCIRKLGRMGRGKGYDKSIASKRPASGDADCRVGVEQFTGCLVGSGNFSQCIFIATAKARKFLASVTQAIGIDGE
jgi:hypothetical protein